MKDDLILAVDLAKNSFQVCYMDKNGGVSVNKAISRKSLITLLTGKNNFALVAMEACGGAHYWARLAKRNGHHVKIIPPRAVKGLQLKQKTDKNDAYAIAIAALLPHVSSSNVMTEEEQGLQCLDRARALQLAQRTALSNQVRAFMNEFGIVLPRGVASLMRRLPDILEDAENGLPMSLRQVLKSQADLLEIYTEQIEAYDEQIVVQTKQNKVCQKLSKLEGVGPMVALGLMVRLGDAEEFTKSRDASACIGLTPKQHSTGGKERLGHISKSCADKRLRSLLYQGAMSIVYKVTLRPPKTEKERWLKAMVERRGKKIAAIALANKTVRTAVALIKSDTEYCPLMLRS
ncbi:mobile element protein [Vibrio astriarenae]|nr:mobile element protein [Vibrio sp. C7]